MSANDQHETSTMNLIIDIINSAELEENNYKKLMERLETFAQTEQVNPTMAKKRVDNSTIPLLPPPPQPPKAPGNLIEL